MAGPLLLDRRRHAAADIGDRAAARGERAADDRCAQRRDLAAKFGQLGYGSIDNYIASIQGPAQCGFKFIIDFILSMVQGLSPICNHKFKFKQVYIVFF